MKPSERTILLVPLIALFLAGAALAAGKGGADAVLGVWMDKERDAKIEIYRCADKYCGKIVWTKDGPALDKKNPAPSLRGRRILGLKIMEGFHFAGGNKWTGGRLYDPKNGHTYSGEMVLVSPDRLRLKGYFLIPLFGKTTTWDRVKSGKT